MLEVWKDEIRNPVMEYYGKISLKKAHSQLLTLWCFAHYTRAWILHLISSDGIGAVLTLPESLLFLNPPEPSALRITLQPHIPRVNYPLYQTAFSFIPLKCRAFPFLRASACLHTNEKDQLERIIFCLYPSCYFLYLHPIFSAPFHLLAAPSLKAGSLHSPHH